MADPRRAETAGAPGAGDDRQVEALLVEGLDRYFHGRFEDAIHLWTRVLFLDRSHARARAYIDRARSAIAERQRRSEELIQASRALIDRGDTTAARDLLSEAVSVAGEDELASAVRAHLERVERARAGGAAPAPVPDGAAITPGWAWRRRPGRAAAVGALLLIAGLGVALVPASRAWLAGPSPGAAPARAAGADTWPVPTSADVALVRARTLFGRGRLAEALRALDRVPASSPRRADADALRIEIQRLLLASAAGPPAARDVPRRP